MGKAKIIGAVLWLAMLAGCGSLPDPPYRYDRTDAETVECVAVCRDQKRRCEGRLARAYQRCLQRHPGNVLEQNRCFDETGPAAVQGAPGQSGTTCLERFDHCFVFACGGEHIPDEEGP